MNTTIFREFPSGVTAPKGFKAAGIFCGIRKKKKDIAMITSDVPAVVAAVFTTSKAQAAPILLCKAQWKKSDYCSALLVNSGNANACTGERGLGDAWTMAETAAETLGISRDEIWISSTGVIGQYLPMEKILTGIRELALALSTSGSHDAALAIMTTDTYSKEYAIQFELGGKTITMGGIAKGSGMIAPNMATMLAFITTDANISPALLKKTLSGANKRTFNRITVDGDTSTNDMAMVLANGLAENPFFEEDSADFNTFSAALECVLLKLSKMIARDGEGATKLIEIAVSGAETEDDAESIARSIANSNLVKTAIHGADANWGRILAAAGYSGVDFEPQRMEISFNDVPVLKQNYEVVVDEDLAKGTLSEENITVFVNLNSGIHKASFWTCDLTKEYIHINASYRS